MIKRIVKNEVIVDGEWEVEEYESDVTCPDCGSNNVWYCDEKQPCDGVELYDGLTYSIECQECGKKFFVEEFLNARLE